MTAASPTRAARWSAPAFVAVVVVVGVTSSIAAAAGHVQTPAAAVCRDVTVTTDRDGVCHSPLRGHPVAPGQVVAPAPAHAPATPTTAPAGGGVVGDAPVGHRGLPDGALTGGFCRHRWWC